ncbi:MAG: YggS family pyridoxal phosphate-dependent enzyme [Deltaproteobacteria bacterium]|nr:YggS family pyridoxal phosphate-dependent enzyme [Deltaproteobacteria bacterium]
MDVATNLARARQRIAAAAVRSGRDPSDVRLVAVSKTHPIEAIREAYEAGQRDFGENYAQELNDKAAALADLADLRWHFIGHLQRNKARMVVPHAAMVETVDSVRLAEELDHQARRLGRALGCLVQVNVGGEEQKSGCTPGEAGEIAGAVESLEWLKLAGLMTIPPFDLDPEETRKHFRALAALRERLGGVTRFAHLSMGMSQDFEAAIEEGATLVRVGTAVFGDRV